MTTMRPNLAGLSSSNLTRSESQKIQSKYFPTVITLKLEEVFDELNDWLRYIESVKPTVDAASYIANTQSYIRAYTKKAIEVFKFGLSQVKTSYERYCMAIFLSEFHTEDYKALLNDTLPPPYSSGYAGRLFPDPSKYRSARKKIAARAAAGRQLKFFRRMVQFMDPKVQRWVKDVVDQKTRVSIPESVVRSMSVEIDARERFVEAVYKNINVV